MRFLHLSTGDARGAFAGAHRLHRNLLARGHESRMLVADKQSGDPLVIAPHPAVQAAGRFAVRAQNQVLKAVCGRTAQVGHHLAINFQLVSPARLAASLGDWRPDLAIVYYTSGFLSADGLAELQERLAVPCVLYLMDMELLTGGCHYAWQCEGYLANCAQCPVPHSSAVRHLIRRQWQQRRRAFARMSPVVVAGSGWLERQAGISRLAAGLARTKILIGIDPDLYAPGDKPALRARFGLPGQALVLYFGAQNLDDPRKGFRHLREALQSLHDLLEPAERARIVLFTVGRLDRKVLGSLPFAHVHLSYIANPTLFAATYAAADLFICPSVEDSGPMMVSEAMVSGTPVVAFEMGVAVDLVATGTTGYRVALGDAAALADALAGFVRLTGPQRAAMSAACRARGLAMCTAQVQVDAFVRLATQLRQSTAP